jgi:hypothetical protein
MFKYSRSKVQLNSTNELQAGLGDTILEMFFLQELTVRGIATEIQTRKLALIKDVLNQTVLDFGMDCNMDMIPDSIQDIDLDTMAETSCCRITNSTATTQRRKTSSSRRQK